MREGKKGTERREGKINQERAKDDRRKQEKKERGYERWITNKKEKKTNTREKVWPRTKKDTGRTERERKVKRRRK